MPVFEMPFNNEPLPLGGLKEIFEKLQNSISSGVDPYTGSIELLNSKNNKTAAIFLKDNDIVFVSMSGYNIPLAKRLYSGGFLNTEQYDSLEGLSLKETSEKAVKEYGVKQNIVDKIYREGFFSILTFLYSWGAETTWRWVPEAQENSDTIPGISLATVMGNLDNRTKELAAIQKNSPQISNVNLYPDRGPNWDTMISSQNNPAEVIALVSRANGERKTSEIANECGFTKFEMSTFLMQLVSMGALVLNKTSKMIPAKPVANSSPVADTPDSWGEPIATEALVPTEMTPEEKMVAFSASFAATAGSGESDWGDLGQRALAGQRKYNKQLTKKVSIVLGSLFVVALVGVGVLYGPKLFGEDPRNTVAIATSEDGTQDNNSTSGQGGIAGDQDDLPKQAGSIIEENAVADDEDIVRVKQTIAIPFDKFSSTLSEEQKNEILAFASRPLDRNETVVISGFAGLNAKEEGNAQRISEERATSIQEVLSQNDINSSIIGYGNTPVDSILGEAMNAAIPEEVDHNRLAFVSAVVVKDSNE
jgi:outer membrane protein OmpA-like peptidoglycan-associated protein